jgi:UDP-3-O-[3-hydroxymyristoyl] N-acetylglucosamine deacetylase
MSLHPAGPDSGVRFRRADLADKPAEIEASWRNAIERPLCTTLANRDGVTVASIEHLMSALLGCGIDNVVIELNAGEVPAMDGSAASFVALIEDAGIEEQSTPRRAVEVLTQVAVREPHRWAAVMPGDGFSVDFEIEFDNPVVARQQWSVSVDCETYKREVAEARTFGFLHDVDKLRSMGMALGGSLDNAVVIDQDRIVNDGGLRFEDEFVRHKVLDAIGDLYLAGGPLIGHFRGVRAGHALTLRLLQALFSNDSAWRWRELRTEEFYADLIRPGGPIQPERAVAAPS